MFWKKNHRIKNDSKNLKICTDTPLSPSQNCSKLHADPSVSFFTKWWQTWKNGKCMKTERPSFATLLITYRIKLCEYWHRGTVWQFITTFEKELKSYGSNISNEPTLWFWTNMFFAHMTPFLKKIIECKVVPKTWKLA